MNEFVIRNATLDDIPFLVETIIEAEKSGSDILSYSAIFGLSEVEVKSFIEKMLLEDVDHCELSISSFKVAMSSNRLVGAVSAWIEGCNGVPSTVIKGNLLNYVFPIKCIERVNSFQPLLKQLHLDNVKNTIQIGLVYVIEEYRGRGLVNYLLDNHINSLKETHQSIESVYVQVFSNNTSAIKTYKKYGFEIIDSKITDDKGRLVRAFSSVDEKTTEDPSSSKVDMATGFRTKGFKTDLKIENGIHRFSWDMRYTGFSANGKNGVLAAPGNYLIEFNYGQKKYTQISNAANHGIRIF